MIGSRLNIVIDDPDFEMYKNSSFPPNKYLANGQEWKLVLAVIIIFIIISFIYSRILNY